MKKFRLLRADEIECRVSTCNEKGCSLLLYKTARTDADLLDETVGAENWTNDFKEISGVLYGGIGILVEDDEIGRHFVWKWDAGTESNTEAEKGRASDAFKRAGFKWGIARELFSSPFIWISAKDCNIKEGRNGKPACNDHFTVNRIEYENDRVSCLEIYSQEMKDVVFTFPKRKQPKGWEPFDPEKVYMCESCGKPLNSYTNKSGVTVLAEELNDMTQKKFGKTLCRKCAAAKEIQEELRDAHFEDEIRG